MDGHARVRSWLESTKVRGMALGLENTRRALEALGLPPAAYETVHIAGSNGKGTTVAMLSAALSMADVPHACFTSPHLVRVEERIRLNGTPVSAECMDDALQRIQEVDQSGGFQLTFFETTFLAAMVIASQADLEVMVLETGLGGRLDATRAVSADVAVLTSIALEHTDILGATLPAIAREKAAIARPGRPMIARVPDDDATQKAIEETALRAGVPALGEVPGPADLAWVQPLPDATAAEEAKALAHRVWAHLKATKSAPFPAFSGVQWPARMHRITSPTRPDRTYFLDGAHNPSGMVKSIAEVETVLSAQPEPWGLLLGASPQQDMAAFLAPLVALMRRHPPGAVVITVPQGGRYPGVEGHVLAEALEKAGVDVTAVHATPEQAVAWFEEGRAPVTTVLSIGSLYMQGNVLQALGRDDDETLSIRAKV